MFLNWAGGWVPGLQEGHQEPTPNCASWMEMPVSPCSIS